MKREKFKKIIKLRSSWKIDKRLGDYKLPSGERISKYVRELIESQMSIDSLLIRENGDLCFGTGGEYDKNTQERKNYILMPPYKNNETCAYEEMERRITILVSELLY